MIAEPFTYGFDWTPALWYAGGIAAAIIAGSTRNAFVALGIILSGLVLFAFTGCASIGSIGLRGSFENEQGFSGGVDIGLRDSKTIKPLH